MVSGVRLRARLYDRQVTELNDGLFYWHLFFRGERINGGLSCSYASAMSAAWYVMIQHIYTDAREYSRADSRADSRENDDGVDLP